MTAPTRTRLPHRTPAILVAAAVVVVVLGVVAGGVWAVLTPAMTAVKGYTRVIAVDSIAGVSAFAFVMLGYGAIAAVLVWIVASAWRGLPGYGVVLVSTVVGSGIAGWAGTLMAARRFPDPDSFSVGQSFRAAPDLWLDGATRGSPSGAWALVVCAPLAATLVYLVLALVSRHGDLGVGDAPPEVAEAPLPAAPGLPGQGH
ncbi:DUF2567 domain-containing protein [Gordonia sp. DT30]|uniref:DUF2567 domain-containing protein n=1 Tax=unclassified Gordonia (in: high G+C Gram-positive bacteria) TaxID=2657482 RepID=UPI003CED904E